MPPDHVAPLQAAAARKHEAALERATGALRELDAAGEPINFQTVARVARVSRQWLYKQPQLRAEIERRRDSSPARAPRVPSTQRASDASLRQRNKGLLDENARLRAENARLKDELALAYGQQREALRRS
jgi:Family of unknown function (DUF6262)